MLPGRESSGNDLGEDETRDDLGTPSLRFIRFLRAASKSPAEQGYNLLVWIE